MRCTPPRRTRASRPWSSTSTTWRRGGQPTLAEFTAAIKDFRSSGKKVIAHSSFYGQEQYYVAAFADEIYLDPLGFVAIDGFDRYRTYYKDLFDKLGVEVNLFRVGAYKSAAEVYIRKDMSPEDREESLAYLNALWLNYRTAVAGARGLKPDDISAYVANSVPAMLAAKGDGAKVALDAKLVTGTQVLAGSRASHGRAGRQRHAREEQGEGSRPTKATPASHSTPPRSRTTCASSRPRRRRAAPASRRSA